MGGGKGGSGTSTQYSGVQIPQEVLQRYTKATDRAETASEQPWANYGGEFVAPVNATQTAGYGQMMAGQGYTNAGWEMGNQSQNAAVSSAQPWLASAGSSIGQGQAQGQALGQAGLGQAAESYRGSQGYNQTAGQAYNQAYGGAQPYQQAATGAAMQGMQAVDPRNLNLNQFLNPYQEQVTQATMAQLNQQQAQQRMDQRGSMIREGSFGGDRAGIANANLANQQGMATGSVLSGLNQQNYNQALAAAQQQQGVGLGAAQANRAAIQQGAGQLLGIGQQGYQQGMGYGQAQQGLGNQVYNQGMGQANYTGQMGQQMFNQGMGAAGAQQGLGQAQYNMYADTGARQNAMANQAFNQNLQTAQGQIGFGSLQQQTQQAQDSALYNQWMQERGYPFQTSQFYTNAVMGTGPLSGSSAYSGSFSPQPFFSDERLKENMEPIGTTHDGQVIYRYNFKGQPGATQIGLSAQEVQEKHPEAVTEHDGAKAVAYGPATEEAAERAHKAVGGALGEDPYAYTPPNTLPPGVGRLGIAPTLPSTTPVTGGTIGDIVTTQRASLAANAPGSGGPPSRAGMDAPQAQQSAAAAPASASAASPVMSAVMGSGGGGGLGAATPFSDAGGSANGATGDGSGSVSGDAGTVGAAVGSVAGTAGATAVDSVGMNSEGPSTGTTGTGTNSGTVGTGGPGNAGSVGTDSGQWASGGRVGYAKGGDASSYSGGFGSLDNILANQQAMYGSVPWAGKGAAGVGNAGIVGAAATPAKASAVLKPPESKTPAAAKSTTDQAKGAIDDVTDTYKKGESLYKAGKGALFGTAAKGKPGDKDYQAETGGLFGRGGDSARYGWLDERDNTTEASGIDAEIKDWSKYAKGGRTGLGRARFEEGGETEDIDAPFTEHSVLPEIPTAEASKAPTPPDPKGEGGGSGGAKQKDQTASAAMKLAGLGASFIPGIGSVAGPLLSIGSSFVKDGGRIGHAEGGEIPLRDPGLGAADVETPQSLYGSGGPGARDLDDWQAKDETFPWDLQSSTGNVPPPREGGVAPSKRVYENSKTYSFADGGEVNDNEPPEPGLASASSAMEDNDNVHWGVFSRSQGHKMVGRATTKNRARTIRDKRDNDYGAYDHFVKPIPPTRKRYAGGRAGFADAGEVALADDEAERKLVEERLRARDEGLGADTAEARPAPTFAPMEREPDPNVKPAPMPQPETPPGAIPGGRPAPMPNGLGTATTDSTTPQPATPQPAPGLNPNAQVIADAVERQRLAGVAGANLQGTQVADRDANTAPKPAVGTERFNAVVGQTLGFEGGLGVDSNGYAVNYGINQKFHPKVDVKKLTQDQVKEIYHREYWTQIDGDNLPPNMQAIVMDAAVNSGVDRAKQWLAQAGNDPQKFMELRREFLTNLAKSDPKQFGPGVVQSWNKRLVALGGKPIEGFGGATTETTPQTPAATPQTPAATPPGSALGAAQATLGDSKSMYGENKDWWDRNEQWSLPLLQGIGAMLSSPSRTLLGSIGTGLEKGAGAYGTLGQRQQQLDISKQQQNIASAGKLSEAMNSIQLEKAGILARDPKADVSAYDEIYNKMRNRFMQLSGAGNVSINTKPSGYADYLKTQSPAIQAYSNNVHPRDDFISMFSNAMTTQNPAERERLMKEGNAALERARAGQAVDKNMQPMGASPELTQALLEFKRRETAASNQGGIEVLKNATRVAFQELDAYRKQFLGKTMTPEQQKELNRLVAVHDAALRAEQAGPSTRAHGGRIARDGWWKGGRIAKAGAGEVTEGEPDPNIVLAQYRPEPPPRPAGAAPREIPAPAPTPVAPDAKPGVAETVYAHSPEAMREEARRAAAMNMPGVADDLNARADEIEKARKSTGEMTVVDPKSGQVTVQPNPGSIQTKIAKELEDKRVANNLEVDYRLQKVAQENAIAEQQLQKMRELFIDKDGNPRLSTGPASERLSAIAAWMEQANMDPSLIYQLANTNPADAQAIKKLGEQLNATLGRGAYGSRPTEAQSASYANTIPHLGMHEATIKHLLDDILIPQAQFNRDLHKNVIQGKNPATSNYGHELTNYFTQNPQFSDRTMPSAAERAAKGAEKVLPWEDDKTKRVPGKVYQTNNGPHRWNGSTWDAP